jgi:hypothetical protein
VRIGYVVDFRMNSIVLVERYPAHPARIPAPGFRPLFVVSSSLLIGYVVDPMMVT